MKLTLRRFIHSEAKRVLEMLGDEGQKMLRPSNLQSAESWISNFPFDRFAVVNDQNVVVGEIHLAISQGNSSAELGYMTAKECEGRGIATEAIRLITAYGFDDLKLNRIWARTSVLNKGSIRALQKAGYFHEATFLESRLIDGRYIDELVFRMLRRERTSVG